MFFLSHLRPAKNTGLTPLNPLREFLQKGQPQGFPLRTTPAFHATPPREGNYAIPVFNSYSASLHCKSSPGPPDATGYQSVIPPEF